MGYRRCWSRLASLRGNVYCVQVIIQGHFLWNKHNNESNECSQCSAIWFKQYICVCLHTSTERRHIITHIKKWIKWPQYLKQSYQNKYFWVGTLRMLRMYFFKIKNARIIFRSTYELAVPMSPGYYGVKFCWSFIVQFPTFILCQYIRILYPCSVS